MSWFKRKKKTPDKAKVTIELIEYGGIYWIIRDGNALDNGVTTSLEEAKILFDYTVKRYKGADYPSTTIEKEDIYI